MASIFGHLNLTDSEYVFEAVEGQEVIYEAATEYLARVNAEVAAATGVFVEAQVDIFKERYKLPGSGYLARRNVAGRYPAVKASGYWDVAYPLEDYGAQSVGDDVSMAYMTVRDLDLHLQTVVTQSLNTDRFHLLKALLHSTQSTFVDPLHGSLSVEALANGDTVVYPPILGAEVEATEDHYLASGYLTAAISDTNNPIATLRDELDEHFGNGNGDGVVVFIDSAATPYVEDLTDFDSVDDLHIAPGADVDRVVDVPTGLPGRVIGRCSGCWVVEWRSLPTAYMIAVHMATKPPLKRRVDPSRTRLPSGLHLVAKEEDFPFEGAFFRNRFGYAVGNRLAGAAMELTAGAWSIPTAYA